MKKIDKNSYREAKYERKHLMTFAVIVLLLSLALLGGGIAMVVLGATSTVVSKIILMCIIGGLLIIISFIGCIVGMIMFFTAKSMIKVKQGSVKDGNRAIGTVNVLKCNKCGEELPDNANFCSKCGTQVDGQKQCNCGAVNAIDAEYCISCGKKLS